MEFCCGGKGIKKTPFNFPATSTLLEKLRKTTKTLPNTSQNFCITISKCHLFIVPPQIMIYIVE
jgi:hypothetical protein